MLGRRELLSRWDPRNAMIWAYEILKKLCAVRPKTRTRSHPHDKEAR